MPLAFIVLTASFQLHASNSVEVYRCEQNGVTIFSQVPCEKSQTGAESKIKVQSSQGKGLSQSEVKARFESAQKHVDSYLRSSEIEAQIAQHHRAIAKLKVDLKQQLAALKEQRFRTGKMRDEAFNAVEKNYQNSVKSHHEAIKNLHEQLRSVNKL